MSPEIESFSRQSPHSLLPEEFGEIVQWYGAVQLVPPRHLPSSSYTSSTLVTGFETSYAPTIINMQAVYNAMRKGTIVPYVFGERIQVEMRAIINHWFGPYMIGARTWSLEEALKDIDFSKSPGFPLYYHCNTKLQAWERDRVYILNQLCSYLENPVFSPIWTGTLKDELTSSDKVEKEATRMFFNGEFSFLIFTRILWGNFSERLTSFLGQHPNTIGIAVPGPELIDLLISYQEWFDFHVSEGYIPLLGGVKLERELVGQFLVMMDSDRKAWDLSISPTSVAVCSELISQILPTESIIDINFPDGIVKTIKFNPAECSARAFEAVFCGNVAVCGQVVQWWGNKSGQYLTGTINSMTEPVSDYPALRPYLGEFPVTLFLKGKRHANGDDGLKGVLLTRQIDEDTYIRRCNQCGTYPTSHSGFTDNAFEMMFLSHKVSRIYFRYIDELLLVARPRESKIISALAYRRTKDDARTLSRFYAACNGLFGYNSRYDALRVVDAWAVSNPVHKNPTEEWKAALAQRLSDRVLASIHTGMLF